MKIKYKEQIERNYYTCDLCGEKVIQDGKDIVLLYGIPRQDDPKYHLHESCLTERIIELSE